MNDIVEIGEKLLAAQSRANGLKLISIGAFNLVSDYVESCGKEAAAKVLGRNAADFYKL